MFRDSDIDEVTANASSLGWSRGRACTGCNAMWHSQQGCSCLLIIKLAPYYFICTDSWCEVYDQKWNCFVNRPDSTPTNGETKILYLLVSYTSISSRLTIPFLQENNPRQMLFVYFHTVSLSNKPTTVHLTVLTLHSKQSCLAMVGSQKPSPFRTVLQLYTALCFCDHMACARAPAPLSGCLWWSFLWLAPVYA